MLITHDASLRRLNTFGVEGRARRLIVVNDNNQLPAALDALASDRERLVLGGGSNILFAGDFDGTILKVDMRGRRVIASNEGAIVEGRASGDAIAQARGAQAATAAQSAETAVIAPAAEVIVEAQAGEPWHGFVQWTLGLGLYGLENLSLIPGTVGAAPMQNIGAYGVELRDCFDSLLAVDLGTGVERRFGLADCGFAYRDSVFRQPRSSWLVRSVRFRLSRAPRVRLDYADLGHRLDPATARPEDVAREVVAIRRSKLPDPAVFGNAGSFFRNPQHPRETVEALAARHPGMPVYPADAPGSLKIAAGWLIEQCGWKGAREGDAGVHERHALVLINYGNASGKQILSLSQAIQGSVQERFGIMLEPEPRIVGTDR